MSSAKLGTPQKPARLLLADKSDGSIALIHAAVKESGLDDRLLVEAVSDGGELLRYLRREHEYKHKKDEPRPHLILLDLDLPKLDGFATMKLLKEDARLCLIPVLVYTVSDQDVDILLSYHLGAKGYTVKRDGADAIIAFVQGLFVYWFELMEHPEQPAV